VQQLDHRFGLSTQGLLAIFVAHPAKEPICLSTAAVFASVIGQIKSSGAHAVDKLMQEVYF
jgi:hypothetical protein